MDFVMNKNAERYYRSACRLRLPVTPLPEIDGFDILLGRRRYFCRGFVNTFNDHCSVTIARNKYCTNKLLEKGGIPVPKAVAVCLEQFENIEEHIRDLRFPLVIKPTKDSQMGQDVLCNIKTLTELKTHIRPLLERYEHVSIEEFYGNLNSYRVFVFKKKVLGIVLRSPAQIVGDGQHTIEELIEITNLKRQQTSEMLAPIEIGDELHIRLNELGKRLSDIPYENEKIILRYVSNASRGGTFKPLGRKICKENRQLLARAAHLLHLNLVGFDIQCQDINSPIETSGGVIIEANANPSVRIHEESLVEDGVPHNVTEAVLRSLIYRHPLSYLYARYRNNEGRVYRRCAIALLLFGVAYKILN